MGIDVQQQGVYWKGRKMKRPRLKAIDYGIAVKFIKMEGTQELIQKPELVITWRFAINQV